ncbi:hypothetical protein Kpol_1002p57 [Vanderwaltozyma polyspora DSM 70294]|uniref:DNA damage checkpoint protein 1 n=1 Tax=Vanderwaltozyma polyspora (strain ATCC 22028 / DSM 70294 / BCRC 21397 / CBS 2163 / NBRC 10782 / NRRL Y-8283 / UCD 57-17) TaxID=436907 RepID=A7TE88_VANPO|nr:uncharacterized protein Kpol_1002p57 [Vanderwaltozyma polyspora DSM 70294]EDO19410.1 hypothetical protein Kpol_1002p57 [Vanderwaltozyma polyspora DSM 70294]
MSFRATVVGTQNQILWFKSLNALYNIREQISFSITSNDVTISAMNDSDTSLCQVTFQKDFFQDFEFKPNEIVFGEEGLQVITDAKGTYHRIYSFNVNGKHLAIISKVSGNDVIKSFTLKINNTSTCPEIFTNRLLVEIEMESAMIKEYTPQISPTKYEPVMINLNYKKKFLDVYSTAPTPERPLDSKLLEVFRNIESQLDRSIFDINLVSGVNDKNKLTSDDEINYFCCHQTLFRNFLENCNPAITDNIKLEININRLTITAYSKSIQDQNKDLLKNAISMSNTISTSSLDNYCLFTTINDDIERETMKKHPMKSIIYYLKDFKNFIGITSAPKNSISNNDNISVWFCRPGFPILMEMKRPGVTFQLAEVTISTDNKFETPVNSSPTKGKVIKVSVSPEKLDNQGRYGKLQPNQKPEPISPTKELRLKSEGIITGNRYNSSHKIVPRELKKAAQKLFVEDASQDDDFVDVNSHSNDKHNTDQHKEDLDTLNRNNFNIDTTNNEPIAERHGTTIGWGKRTNEMREEQESPTIAKTSNQDSAMDKENSNTRNETPRLKQPKNELDLGFGPTQPDTPKGLFD